MSVYSVAEVYHQILYIRQKENGRTSIPWCLCVFAQLVDGVVQCCSNSVMHLCLWMVMHSLDIHAWLAVTGKTDTFSKFTILCQSLEDKPFFNNVWFWQPFRSYHDSRNYLAFVVSSKRGERWQTCMADILHQFFWVEVHLEGMENYILAKVLLSCRFESNMHARSCLCRLQETEWNSYIYFIPIVLKHKLKAFTVTFLINSVIPACSKYLWSKLNIYCSWIATEREGE